MSTSGPALALDPRESRILRRVRHALYALALAGVLCAPVPFAVRAACFALALGGLVRGARGRPAPIVHLELRTDGACRSLDRQGGQAEWRLGPDSLSMPGLILLSLVGRSGARRDLWLPADALDPESRRRLRVRVRLAA